MQNQKSIRARHCGSPLRLILTVCTQVVGPAMCVTPVDMCLLVSPFSFISTALPTQRFLHRALRDSTSLLVSLVVCKVIVVTVTESQAPCAFAVRIS